MDTKISAFLGHFNGLWGKVEQTVEIRMILKIRIYDQCKRNLCSKRISQKVESLQAKWSLEEIIHTPVQCYSKCDLPPGADPQSVYQSARTPETVSAWKLPE